MDLMAVWSGVKCESYGDHPSSSAPNPTGASYQDIHKRFGMGHSTPLHSTYQGGITCGAIEDPRKSSKAIDERVIINFRDKNVVIAHYLDK